MQCESPLNSLSHLLQEASWRSLALPPLQPGWDCLLRTRCLLRSPCGRFCVTTTSRGQWSASLLMEFTKRGSAWTGKFTRRFVTVFIE